MRIQIASDLHLEHLEWRFPDYRGVEFADADLLVLAGDIANGARGLDLFADWPVPVIYVPGNHEYYGHACADIRSQLARKAGALPNLAVLDEGVKTIGGLRFIGCTLWTDYALFGEGRRESAMAACAASLPDHRVIRGEAGVPFAPAYVRQLHFRQKAWLRARLDEPFAGKTVVITHHAPARGSLHPVFATDPVSAAFVSDLGDMLGIAALHIHGHTHHSFDYEVNATRVIANPMGYCQGVKSAASPLEVRRENPDFQARLVVEL